MKKQISRSRRSFFKKLALLGGSAALAGLSGRRFDTGKRGPQAAAEASRGYRLTPHIKTYYRTADS
jgi:hypothetical protein